MNSKPHALLAMDEELTRGLMRAEHIERIRSLCRLVEPNQGVDPARHPQLDQLEILITSWGCKRLDADFLERAPHLRAIFHAAGSVKSHISAACFERGIVISSAATANAIPVAEYTLAAILWALKGVLRISNEFRNRRDVGDWDRHIGRPTLHRHVGLIGASRIGREVIRLLGNFDHLTMMVSDPYLSQEEAKKLGVVKLPLDELLPQVDVLSVHAPALEETKNLLDASRLAKLRTGATIINTARGSLIDQEALIGELQSGRLHAIIDTTEPFILPADSPLYSLPNVVYTPHIAGSIGPEKERMMDLALDELERFLQGRDLAHQVFAADLERSA